MPHTLYDNFVLKNKFQTAINTKLNARNFMRVDNDIKENVGTKKVINVYSYSGEVEKLAKGQKNTNRGVVSYTPVEYRVDLFQQTFSFYDEDVRVDPLVVDYGLKGMAEEMFLDMNAKFFAELGKATLTGTYGDALNYDAIVDGIAKMNLEDETGLIILINPGLKAEIRKDADFKSAKMGEMLFKGHIGEVSGLPVVVSKQVPVDTAYIVDISQENGAVTLFTKVDAELEQDRDIETRETVIVGRKVNLVALTDATRLVKLTKGA